jgi:signal transduction histidine kinase/CheY-like chemotaxis protein
MLAIGAPSLVQIGFRGAGVVWVAIAAIVAGMLLGVRWAMAVVAAIALLFVAVAVAIAGGVLPWAADSPHALRYWLVAGASTVFLTSLASIGLGTLLKGIQRESAARAEAEEALRQARQLEALGTLAGGIAHDFNNLLAPVLANVELLAPAVAPAQRHLLEDVRVSAERGRDLVRRLLAFSRGREDRRSPLDLVVTLNEVARLVRPRAPGITIQVTARPAPAVGATAAELHQIVMNLVVNAVQATEVGGEVLLSIGACEVEGRPHTELVVRDTGHGMDEAVEARAFDPFFTTRGETGGTGLGLSTVHSIATRLGGSVRIRSAPGRGTRVTVRLPAVSSTPALAPAHRATPASGAPVLPSPAPRPVARVLVVDDEPLVLDATCRMLRALGFTVVPQPGPHEAEAWIDAGGRCDLLLTDYRMPACSGAELARRLRARDAGLPVIVASGFIDDARDALELLGEEVRLLPKPFTRGDLREALAGVAGALPLVAP